MQSVCVVICDGDHGLLHLPVHTRRNKFKALTGRIRNFGLCARWHPGKIERKRVDVN